VSAPFLHAGWLTGRIGLKSAIGKMIPQPRVAGSNGQFAMLDALIGNGFVLLGDGIDPASLLTRHERAQWDALDAQYHAVLTPDQFGGDDRDIIDIEGSLTGWMRQHGARVIAVRPDRFVAASDASGLAVPGAALPVRAELAPA
jgi:3-(3-hydroxy-phenyl)propionate hydroxylase